jgi:hypothetical protein
MELQAPLGCAFLSYKVARPVSWFKLSMNNTAKTWLQLYVDAMTEKDPYKRLSLVRELRNMPRYDDSEELPQEPVIRSVKRPKVKRRH